MPHEVLDGGPIAILDQEGVPPDSIEFLDCRKNGFARGQVRYSHGPIIKRPESTFETVVRER